MTNRVAHIVGNNIHVSLASTEPRVRLTVRLAATGSRGRRLYSISGTATRKHGGPRRNARGRARREFRRVALNPRCTAQHEKAKQYAPCCSRVESRHVRLRKGVADGWDAVLCSASSKRKLSDRPFFPNSRFFKSDSRHFRSRTSRCVRGLVVPALPGFFRVLPGSSKSTGSASFRFASREAFPLRQPWPRNRSPTPSSRRSSRFW